MKNKKTLIASIGIVILNIVIGHFLAPMGILLTPIVLIAIALIIWFGNNELSLTCKGILLGVLISFHDIGIKLFSGGIHDYEGKGWIHAMLFIGLIPAFGILVGGAIKDKNEPIRNKWIAVVLFSILISLHLLIFEDLGIGRYYWYDWNR